MSMLSNLTQADLAKDDTSTVFNHIVNENSYVKSCSTNKKRELHSLSYLIDRPMSQSDSIKMGHGVENVLRDCVLKQTNLIDIKPKNSKGNKERDHLFINEDQKIIYYAECKANLNLDTEKSRVTWEKCVKITTELQNSYPDYKILMFLVGCRYYTTNAIPSIILGKYANIKENVVGVNEYFSALGVNLSFVDEGAYKKSINHLANKMFDKNIILKKKRIKQKLVII